jgi:hypothetical protein
VCSVRRAVSDAAVSDARRQASGVRRAVSEACGVSRAMSDAAVSEAGGVRRAMSGERCQASGDRRAVTDEWCQAGGVRRAVSGGRCQAGGVRRGAWVVSETRRGRCLTWAWADADAGSRRCQTRGVRGVSVRRADVRRAVSDTRCQRRGVRRVRRAGDRYHRVGGGGWRKTALRAGDRGAHHRGACVPPSV